jgi:hypothetical protein
LIVLATQLTRLEQEAAPTRPEKAQDVGPPATPADKPTPEVIANTNERPSSRVEGNIGHKRKRSVVRRQGDVAAAKPEAVKSEGEMARDQLMLALQVASASLNEAQRMVSVVEDNQPRSVAR